MTGTPKFILIPLVNEGHELLIPVCDLGDTWSPNREERRECGSKCKAMVKVWSRAPGHTKIISFTYYSSITPREIAARLNVQ